MSRAMRILKDKGRGEEEEDVREEERKIEMMIKSKQIKSINTPTQKET